MKKNSLYRYIFPYRYKPDTNIPYVQSGKEIQLLQPDKHIYNWYNMAGPVTGELEFSLYNDYSIKFYHKPFFEYEFSNNMFELQKVKESRYPEYLVEYNFRKPALNEEIITLETIKKEWQEYINNKRMAEVRYHNPVSTKEGFGKLKIDLTQVNILKKAPLNHLLFRYDNPEFLRIYPGSATLFHELEEGIYELVSLFPDDEYHVVDSVFIRNNGTNYRKIEFPTDLKKDSFSIQVNNLIAQKIIHPLNSQHEEHKELKNIYRTYQEQFLYMGAGETITGIVVDEQNEPLAGVYIYVKETTYGTISDANGQYSIVVPHDKNQLLFSYLGYNTYKLDLTKANSGMVQLQADYNMMDEIVVVGYGVSTKSHFTGAVSTLSSNDLDGYWGESGLLQGKAAGLSLSSNNLMIRGVSSVSTNENPLIVIDGIIYTGSLDSLDPATVQNMSVLKSSDASAIYGARAANGVILIDTRNGNFKNTDEKNDMDVEDEFIETALQASSIRTNFSDYAYWEPRLNTDKEGKAKFKVTFPDDVTNWSTFVLAMNDKKQSGQTQENIRSFKPLMAQLSLPNFLIEGDTVSIIGKALNYIGDSAEINTSFEVEKELVYEQNAICINSLLDTFKLAAPADSVLVRYTMKKPDGYFDGEEREIPVFSPGLEEAKGEFVILDKDTTLNFNFNTGAGQVHLYTKADLPEIMESEIRTLANYRYLCNEQLASKLKALLAEKKIAEYTGKKWKNDNKIEHIIKLLLKARNETGLWGWWKNSETNYSFSNHILSALIEAKEQGFKINLKESEIAEILVACLERKTENAVKIEVLRSLKSFEAPVDYNHYIGIISTDSTLNLNSFLKLQRLKQQNNLPVDMDSINTFRHTTLFGNIYYQDVEKNIRSYELENNTVQNTSLAYQILKNDSTTNNNTILSKIRVYFLEIKTAFGWGNTYQTARVVETILPDILADKQQYNSSVLELSGDINTVIKSFPMDTLFEANSQVSVTKRGDEPVYLTFYQYQWNKCPEEKQVDFIINTHFRNRENNMLEAGKDVQLIVELEVKNDADYVMINVPVPAGCSYAGKKQGLPNEIHREYFKNETAIFCQGLKKGNYTFEIDLIPRFTGTYHLNPAKVELMYFTTFNANNEIKKVEIK